MIESTPIDKRDSQMLYDAWMEQHNRALLREYEEWKFDRLCPDYKARGEKFDDPHDDRTNTGLPALIDQFLKEREDGSSDR